MKKKAPFIVLLLFALVLAACGGDTGELVDAAATEAAKAAATAAVIATDVADGPDGGDPTEVPTEEPTEEPTAEPTEEPTPEPTEEPTATPEPTAIPVSGLTGQVVDSDSNLPLAGAQVCVQGTDQCASVDESGMYSLAELDPAEYVVEVTAADYVTATQTISLAAGETLTQDFALIAEKPILAVLPDDVVLRGAIFNFPGNKRTIEIGDTFEFLVITSQSSFPNYNIFVGDSILYTGINYNQIEIFVPKRSETELGKAADAQLEGPVFTVTAVGDVNQPLMLDDQMEVVLTDPSSSNPPYTVNFYRGEGEARELVATFTIDKQQ